jgi:hypothetical protein
LKENLYLTDKNISNDTIYSDYFKTNNELHLSEYIVDFFSEKDIQVDNP